jgi:hypothetical protein
MWDALSRYQPYADADGHGESWRVMCEERTAYAAAEAEAEAEAAYAAARAAAVAAANATYWSENVAYWSALAIERINQAIKEREPMPSNIDPLSNVNGQAQTMDAQPEPVAFFNPQTNKFRWAKPTSWDAPVTIAVPELPLYTAPPKRQPLTDEEIDALSCTMVKGNKSVNWLCRAIEKAHGIGGDK